MIDIEGWKQYLKKALMLLLSLIIFFLVYWLVIRIFGFIYFVNLALAIVWLIVAVSIIMLPQVMKNKAWKKFADDNGLEIGKSWLKGLPAVTGNYRAHAVEAFVEARRSGSGSVHFTHCTVEFKNPNNILMSLYEESLITKIKKKLVDMPDIQLNDPEFDSKFIIKGSSQSDIIAILDPYIRSKIINTKNFHIEIAAENPNFAYFSEGGWTDIKRLQTVLDTMIDIVERIEKMR